MIYFFKNWQSINFLLTENGLSDPINRALRPFALNLHYPFFY